MALFENGKTGYQIVRDGKPYDLADVSRITLIEELVKLMDLVETIDDKINDVQAEIRDWRFSYRAA